MESIEIQCQACPRHVQGPLLFGGEDMYMYICNRIAPSPAAELNFSNNEIEEMGNRNRENTKTHKWLLCFQGSQFCDRVTSISE